MTTRGGGFGRWIRIYVGLGVIWCLVTNLIATLTGTASAFLPAGTLAGGDKLIAVVKIAARQVLLWPMDIYEKVLRPIFG